MTTTKTPETLQQRTILATYESPLDRWCGCKDSSLVLTKTIAPVPESISVENGKLKQDHDMDVFGYVVECSDCQDWRFLRHDWRENKLGAIELIKVPRR